MTKCIGKECEYYIDYEFGVCNFEETIFGEGERLCPAIEIINELEETYKQLAELRVLIFDRQEGEA